MSSKHANNSSTKRAKPVVLRAMRIRTVDHLARMLSCSEKELRAFAADPLCYYKAGTFIDSKGKSRPKMVPVGRLRHISERLNQYLQRLGLGDAQHGGRRGRSYLTNAEPHVRHPALLKLDIRKFFPHVTTEMVRKAFRYRCQCSPEVARLLAAMLTPNGCLPQGAPHSSIVAAIAIERLTARLSNLARQHRATYTQYVDDITISGPLHVSKLEGLVCKIIRDEGFVVAEDKIAVELQFEEQTVTGVRVNQQMDATSRSLAEAKRMIHDLVCGRPPLPSITSIEGKIASVCRLNPGAAKHLRHRLNKAVARTWISKSR